jgi:hypothetical protein
MQDNTIFFQCKVLDNQDPMMLGRIRGVRIIDNPDDILQAVKDPPWNPEKDLWTSRDPLVFNPLLPFFLYQTPKVDELIQVLYLNKDFKYQNQYFVQNAFSSPTATFKEFNFGSNKYTGTGMQIKSSKPLKNKDGTYTDRAIHKGVFPEPGDNALLGRGSADVVVKQDETLIRAGKFKGESLQPNVIPVNNPQRSFLQLSRFQYIKKNQPDRTFFELQENVVLTKYLIEWVVINPENTQDKFTGAVYLYQLKPDATINSKNLKVNSIVKENLKSLVYQSQFTMLSLTQTIEFINNFIKDCNDTGRRLEGNKIFPRGGSDEKFPIFYRPSPLMYSKIDVSSPIGASSPSEVVKNITQIYQGVKLLPGIKGGYGLIYAKNKVGEPTVPKKIKVPDVKYINQPNTVGALGADKVYFLSHNSQIPGKGKINFDNTLYGIGPEQFADIETKTSSTVRGEELLELINMIVRFLVTHTHAYPGLPPVTVTQDGSNTQDILTELQNAVNKILNSNIRLN